MGYTTYFDGLIAIDPPLNHAEREYLNRFATTRRMNRTNGPYFVHGSEPHGQGRDPDIIDYNEPPPGQPGLWCHWVPTPDGRSLAWDEGEKFYQSAEWMAYLIDHFLKPGAHAEGEPGFEDFRFDHILTGVIEAQGEEPEDRWRLIVADNNVYVEEAEVKWSGNWTPVRKSQP